jgi:hypothetical protein
MKVQMKYWFEIYVHILKFHLHWFLFLLILSKNIKSNKMLSLQTLVL